MSKAIAWAALCGLIVVISLTLRAADMPDAPPATQPATAPTTQVFAKAINKFCAVEQDNPVDNRVPTYDYKGQAIGFCCPDCEAEFKKNPDKYMATLK